MIESLSPSAKIKLHSHKWHQKSIANRTTNSETLPQPKLIDVQPMNRRIEQIAPYKLHLIGSEWGTSKHQTTTSNLYFPTNEGGNRDGKWKFNTCPTFRTQKVSANTKRRSIAFCRTRADRYLRVVLLFLLYIHCQQDAIPHSFRTCRNRTRYRNQPTSRTTRQA